MEAGCQVSWHPVPDCKTISTNTKDTRFHPQTELFERLARVVETVGSSQVDDLPASFKRFRGLDKEGRSFRLLARQISVLSFILKSQKGTWTSAVL